MMKDELLLISLGILRNRKSRRKFILSFTLLTIFFLIIGTFVIDKHLEENLILFLIYWIFSVALVLLMILFALYDMLACRSEIIKEGKQELEKIVNKMKDDLPNKKGSKTSNQNDLET
tara:strand:- start:1586 stop:1939 length:354 start_codon:yes stop_codon:yes gene_type:complete